MSEFRAPFSDLQAFLRHLERIGELRRVTAPVSSKLEITELAHRALRGNGPALLFENVEGSSYPLAINVFASHRRVEAALGRHPEEIGEELARTAEALMPPSPSGLWGSRGTIAKARNLRLSTHRPLPWGPTRGAGPLCREVEESPDLNALPALHCWPEDPGPFITFPLVLTRSPKSGGGNMGIYRMQVFDHERTGMHWQIQKGGGFHYDEAEKMGRPLEVAVAIGADPMLLIASVCALPEGIDEMRFAGFLRGKPTRVTKARTVNVDVPADAEFVLEGIVPPQIREHEGPFGDHFGHYSHAGPFPVFQVRKVTRRKNPVYLGIVVGKPPQEDVFLGDATQAILGPLIRLNHPEIRNVWAYFEAGYHSLLVASVHQRYGKEAKKAAFGILGEGQLSLTKVLVTVDADVDPRDWDRVLDEIRKNFDPREDFLLLPGTAFDTLDFTSYRMNVGSKMIIDATSKVVSAAGETRNGEEAAAADSVRDWHPERVDPRVTASNVFGDALGVVQVEKDGREVVEALVKAGGAPRIVAAVSQDVDVSDRTSALWGIFTRFDPARDIVFESSEMKGSWPVYSGTLGIDATWKQGYPNPVEMTDEIIRRVDERWKEYGIPVDP